eukprot:g370.t1
MTVVVSEPSLRNITSVHQFEGARWSAIGFVVSTDFVIFFVPVLLFLVRRWWLSPQNNRARLGSDEDYVAILKAEETHYFQLRTCSLRSFSDLCAFLKMPLEEVRKKCGADVAAYLHFEQYMMVLLLFFTIVGCGALLPYNMYVSSNISYGGEKDTFSLSTIEALPANSWVLWPHIIFTWMFTISIFFVYSRIATTDETPRHSIEKRTVFIGSGIPPHVSSGEDMKSWLSLCLQKFSASKKEEFLAKANLKVDQNEEGGSVMPNASEIESGTNFEFEEVNLVENVILIRDLHRLQELHSQREQDLNGLERRRLLRIAEKENEYHEEKEETIYLHGGDDGDGNVYVEHEQEYAHSSSSSPSSNVDLSCSWLFGCDDTSEYADMSALSHLEKLKVEEKELLQEDFIGTGKAFITFRTAISARNFVMNFQQLRLFLRRQNVDASRRLNEKKSQYRRQASLMGMRYKKMSKNNPFQGEEEKPKKTPLENKEITVAEAIVQSEIVNWENVSIAPRVKDINWRRLRMPPIERKLKLFGINVLIILLLVVCTTPTSVIALLRSHDIDLVKGWALIGKVLKELGHTVGGKVLGWEEDLLFAYLPGLLLIVMNAVLAEVLYCVGRYVEPFFTYSSAEKSIMGKTFIFYLLNSLILPALSLASVSDLISASQRSQLHCQKKYSHAEQEEFQHHHGKFSQYIMCNASLFGRIFLRGSGAYFVIYVIHRAHLTNLMSLLRIPERVYFWFARNYAVTATEKKVASENWPFECGQQYSLQLEVLAICVVFSTTVPFILPCGLLFFVYKYFVDKYNLLYVWQAEVKSSSPVRRQAERIFLLISLLQQILMLGFLGMRGTEWQFRLSFLVFCLSCALTYGLIFSIGFDNDGVKESNSGWLSTEWRKLLMYIFCRKDSTISDCVELEATVTIEEDDEEVIFEPHENEHVISYIDPLLLNIKCDDDEEKEKTKYGAIKSF